MRNSLFLIIIISLVFLFALIIKNKGIGSSVSSKGEFSANWLTDLSLVRAKAKEEGKPILMDFTGSDWCGWCIKLKNEVFSQPAFINYANENLVLMTVDFPSRKQQEKSLIEQNNTLMDTYSIDVFPTIILSDADGKVIGQMGYRRGGPVSYVDHIKGLLNN